MRDENSSQDPESVIPTSDYVHCKDQDSRGRAPERLESFIQSKQFEQTVSMMLLWAMK